MLRSDVRHAVAYSPSSSIWPLSIPDLVFFLIQLELRRHPTNLAYIAIAVIANRPKNIRIHLAASFVRRYPLRFNSSDFFCDGRAIYSTKDFPIPIHTTSFRGCGLRKWTATTASLPVCQPLGG